MPPLPTIARDLALKLGARAFALRPLPRDSLIVLNFHRVNPAPNPYWPAMNPSVFRRVLIELGKRFAFTSFSQLREAASSVPSIIVSFDDGFRDFVTYALPVLDELGVRANLNVIPECVETGLPHWGQRVYDVLAHVPSSRLDGSEVFRRLGLRHDGTTAGRERTGLLLARHLKYTPRGQRSAWLAELDAMAEEYGVEWAQMMCAREVKQIARYHDVGAHGFSHDTMGVETDEFFREDFTQCEEYFNTRLELPLRYYAFPNGSYRPSQVRFLLAQDVERILLVGETTSRTSARVVSRLTMYGATPDRALLVALGLNTIRRQRQCAS